MSEFYRFRGRNRDEQDLVERGLWGGIEKVDGAGAILRVRGTATEDLELPIYNLGYGFDAGSGDFNAEVVMPSYGSDTSQKYALASIPRDKQHFWDDGTGGVQHPTNPDRRVEFNGSETWLKDGTFILGHDKGVKVEVNGNDITITTGTLTINADVQINGTLLRHNAKDVGDTHRHGGVETGGGITAVPV